MLVYFLLSNGLDKGMTMKRLLVKACIGITALAAGISYAKNSGLMFNVTASGPQLSINTTIPNHTYPNAGIKINTPGFSLSGAGTECTMASNGYCLFSVSDTQAKTISITGTGTMSATLCLNGSGPLSCQDYNGIKIQTNAKYAYFTNEAGSTPVTVCTLNQTTGAIVSCQSAGGGSAIAGIEPEGIVINNTNTIAYISPGTDTPHVYQCPINGADGTFGTCTSTTITSPSGYYAYYGFLTLNPANNIIYLANYGGTADVFACSVNNGVINGACQSTGITNFNYYVVGLALNKTATTAYIGHGFGSGQGVTVCSVNGPSFSGCVNKTGGGGYTFVSPAGVALNASGNILYIADEEGNTVYGCSTTTQSGASFNSCFPATTQVPDPWAITVNADNTTAYVTNYGNTVYTCPIVADGTFGTCTPTTGFHDAVDVALAY